MCVENFALNMRNEKKYCQKWDLNPRPQTRTRTLARYQREVFT